MRRMFRRVAFGCFVLAAAATAHSAEPRYLLWEVPGTHNTVYLLGSVHLLHPEELVWPASIEAAYEDAESLVFEIDLDDLDPAGMQAAMMTRGLLPADRTLRSVLGEETWTAMATQARDLGIEPAVLDRFAPWVAALTLVQAQMAALGLESASGVEQRFLRRAVGDHKEVLGLETPGESIDALASLPLERQREFIDYTLLESESMAAELDDMLRAWRAGDTDALAALLDRGFGEFPDLYGPLTVDRNRRWVETIETWLDDDDDDYLVIVGSLHLVGAHSVLDLLEAAGHDVRRR
jgi:uncharacterized protein YbaP (TraB family)